MIHIERYTPKLFNQWNRFVKASNNGTIFHRLDFLSYHGDKYKDNEHHLIWYKDENIIALMPIAIFTEDGKKIAKSPYGASYGGIVFNEFVSLKDAEEVVSLLLVYLKNLKINELRIVNPPSIYYSRESNYIDFFFIKNDAKRINSDLTSYINVTKEPLNYFNHSAVKAVKKAKRNRIIVAQNDDTEKFYKILIENRKRFSTTPVHSLSEIKWLMKNIPEDIILFMAYLDKIPIAGTLVFKCNKRVVVDFYWAHLDNFQQYRPVSALVYEVSRWAYKNNIKYFDFGTQTVNMIPSYGGSRFKETFNATGIFRITYSWVN